MARTYSAGGACAYGGKAHLLAHVADVGHEAAAAVSCMMEHTDATIYSAEAGREGGLTNRRLSGGATWTRLGESREMRRLRGKRKSSAEGRGRPLCFSPSLPGTTDRLALSLRSEHKVKWPTATVDFYDRFKLCANNVMESNESN